MLDRACDKWLNGTVVMNLFIYLYMFVVCSVPQVHVDYLQEVTEFEAELLKNAHKFPHDILYQ